MPELRTGLVDEPQQTDKTAALSEGGIGAGWRHGWGDAEADAETEAEVKADAQPNKQQKARPVATWTSLCWWLILAFVAVTVVSELQYLPSPDHQPRRAGQSLARISLLGSARQHKMAPLQTINSTMLSSISFSPARLAAAEFRHTSHAQNQTQPRIQMQHIHHALWNPPLQPAKPNAQWR